MPSAGESSHCKQADSVEIIRKSSRLHGHLPDFFTVDPIVIDPGACTALRIHGEKRPLYLFPDRKYGIILQVAVAVQFPAVSRLLIVDMNKRRLFFRPTWSAT